jgi:uncharacterized membrane protein YphA (DoxX/SURF4 family)
LTSASRGRCTQPRRPSADKDIVMFIAYAIVAVLLAVILLASSAAKLTRREQIVTGLTSVAVPLEWFPRLASLEIVGAIGLVVGMFVPVIGVAAALGIILYFIGAVRFHVVAHDTTKLARFWGDVLGWHLSEGATPERAVLDVGNVVAGVPRLTFNQVPEGKVTKNRLHLDLISDSFDADTERVMRLGARQLAVHHVGESAWITFADIEGNEFDLVAG